MADIAQLGLSVRSDGVVVATDRLHRMERQSGRTEGAALRMAKSLKSAFAGMALAAAAMFGGQNVIKEARAFNAALAEVSTLLPVVAGEIDVVTDASRRMSREFGGPAKAQAQAFYQAISAGAGDASAATKLLEVANRTAIGGVTDVTTAVDVLTTAQNAYAASGLTAADAADTLFVGMRAGKTTVGELARFLGKAIPQATAVGISFDELVAATAALTTQGQSTGMAITGLSGIMTQLLKPSSQALELAQQLGIEFNATKASTMGLAEFMAYLVEKTDGSQEALATLFGSTESLRAVFSLAGQGGVKFNEILVDMENRAGAADEAFGRVSKGLDQRLNVVTAKFGDIALGIGNTLLTVLVPALEGAAVAAEFLGDHMDRLLAIGIVIVTFFAVKYAAAIGVSMVRATMAAVAEAIRLEIALGATSRTAALSSIAIKGLSLSLKFLRAAIISTGIGVLVIAAGEMIYRFMQLSDAVGGFGNALVYLKELGLEVWDRMKIGAGALWEYMRAFGAGYVLLWQQAFASVIRLFASFIDSILDGTRNAMLASGNLAAAAAIEASRASIKAAISDSEEAARANVDAQKAIVDAHKNTADQMVQDAVKPLYMWQALTDVIEAARRKASGEFGAGTVGAVPPVVPTDPNAPGGGAANDNSDAISASRQFIDSLQDEVLQLSMTEEAYRRLQVEKAAAMAPTAEMAEQIRLLGELREVTLAQFAAEAMSEEQRVNALQRFQALGDQLRSNIDNPAMRLQAQYEEQLAVVDQYEQAYTDKIAEANAARLEIEREYQDAKLRLTLSSGEQAAGALAGAFQTMLGEQSGAYKTMFAIQQAFVIATASLNIAKAMSEAMALPFPANLAAWATVATNAAQIMSAVNSVALGFAEGGYTGAGGKHDVAGLVHKGEVVWSQQDVARYGGWQNVDAMRRGAMPAANDNGYGGRIQLDVNVTVDDDGRVAAYVTEGMNEAVNASVRISDQRTKARMEQAQEDASRPRISARSAA